MNWRKLGKVFQPNGKTSWMKTHASNPIASIKNDKIIIYFSARDENNISRIGWVEVDVNDLTIVKEITKQPIFDIRPTDFDGKGASVGCIVMHSNMQYLYYLGWNIPENAPFKNQIGLAISNNEKVFIKKQKKTIMAVNKIDPYTISYPYVIKDEGKFKMWYGSHQEPQSNKNQMWHCIKYAESNNGINWKRKNKICIETNARHHAFSRPMVIKESGLYKMWYSYRGPAYRIGYAESKNGIDWERKDEQVGIDVSPSGWDSEMIEYPYVFDHNGNRYMLYNGNGYGKTGFGLAILEQD